MCLGVSLFFIESSLQFKIYGTAKDKNSLRLRLGNNDGTTSLRMREIGMAENFSLLKKSKFSLD